MLSHSHLGMTEAPLQCQCCHPASSPTWKDLTSAFDSPCNEMMVMSRSMLFPIHRPSCAIHKMTRNVIRPGPTFKPTNRNVLLYAQLRLSLIAKPRDECDNWHQGIMTRGRYRTALVRRLATLLPSPRLRYGIAPLRISNPRARRTTMQGLHLHLHSHLRFHMIRQPRLPIPDRHPSNHLPSPLHNPCHSRACNHHQKFRALMFQRY
jgi:hypothetical protein